MTPGQPVLIRGFVSHAVPPNGDVCVTVPSGHLWVSPKDIALEGEPLAAGIAAPVSPQPEKPEEQP